MSVRSFTSSIQTWEYMHFCGDKPLVNRLVRLSVWMSVIIGQLFFCITGREVLTKLHHCRWWGPSFIVWFLAIGKFELYREFIESYPFLQRSVSHTLSLQICKLSLVATLSLRFLKKLAQRLKTFRNIHVTSLYQRVSSGGLLLLLFEGNWKTH